MEKAKALRDMLCMDCVCTFDKGCECIDAIKAALDGAQLAGFHAGEASGLKRAAEIAAASREGEDALMRRCEIGTEDRKVHSLSAVTAEAIARAIRALAAADKGEE
ncbi:MAG: hypothetical protein ACREFC_09585 [Stellaceae bacterium]